MNLKLEVFKTDSIREYSQGRHIRFAVVDSDKSKGYPANFICLLPMEPRPNGKSQNSFSKTFGENSLRLAERLLTKALETEKDSEIKAEMERRLELLKPKPAVQVRCRVCGKAFEYIKRSGYKQTLCQECKQKRYTSKP